MCVMYCRWLSAQTGLPEAEQAYLDPATLDPSEYPRDGSAASVGSPRNWPLAGLDRRGFRLPTELEWELACRAGTGSGWSFGDDRELLSHYAWFMDSSRNQLHLPRLKRPNPAGLFDMHGNVVEWCHNWFRPRMGNNIEALVQLDPGKNRVIRGGRWDGVAIGCRSARRLNLNPDGRSDSLGFGPVDLVYPHFGWLVR